MSQHPRYPRRGFTIAEMLVAMTLLLVIVGLTVPFFRAQARALDRSAGRLDAQQNARFGVNAIDRDLRVAGLGVVDAQPIVIYAGSRMVAFNADLATAVPGDGSAVYFNPDLPPNVLTSIGKPDRFPLPGTSAFYPETTYRQGAGGVVSAAETIIFWVAQDTSSVNPADYALWRQVNNTTPAQLATGLRLTAGEPVFRYVKTDSAGRPVAVPQASLPLFHSAPIHGIVAGPKADTGSSARTDSIQAVRVRLVGAFKDPRDNEVLDTVEVNIRILNAGLNRYTSCGDRPIFSGTPVAQLIALPSGASAVRISWSRSIDEMSGERDVERYAVYRRRAGKPEFDSEPITIMPAGGGAGYDFVDTDVVTADSWQYGVDAQDCTPSASPVAATLNILIP